MITGCSEYKIDIGKDIAMRWRIITGNMIKENVENVIILSYIK
jgi:hypothetical protein